MIGLILSSLILLVITYQDLKERSIHWITIPLLFVSLLWWKDFTGYSIIETAKNLLFIIAIMVFLTAYISVKHRSFQNITKSYFGWGDILFLLAITPAFTNQAFMLFFIVGTIIVLIISLIMMKLNPSFKVIPYAGLFALFFNITILPAVIVSANINDYEQIILLYVNKVVYSF